MICEVCYTKMENEPCFEQKEVHYKLGERWVHDTIEVPAAFYQCPNCGNSFTWVKGKGLKGFNKPDAEDLVDLMAKVGSVEDTGDSFSHDE